MKLNLLAVRLLAIMSEELKDLPDCLTVLSIMLSAFLKNIPDDKRKAVGDVFRATITEAGA